MQWYDMSINVRLTYQAYDLGAAAERTFASSEARSGHGTTQTILVPFLFRKCRALLLVVSMDVVAETKRFVPFSLIVPRALSRVFLCPKGLLRFRFLRRFASSVRLSAELYLLQALTSCFLVRTLTSEFCFFFETLGRSVLGFGRRCTWALSHMDVPH